MSEKQELSVEQLEKVSGGNHGDKALEYGETSGQVKYLYQVNQHVEVYIDTLIHVHTKGGIIQERIPYYVGTVNGKANWCGKYKVLYDEGGDEWVLADEIER